MDVVLRPATAGDAADIAALMNLAGEGIPAWLWSQMAGAGGDAMAFGADRVRRREGAFSYINAHVALVAGRVAGMLLSYRLDDSYVLGPMEDYPEPVWPLVQLEAQVPGSWYINGVATYAAFRGCGIGARLMELAEGLALGACAAELSLIVAGDNASARRLYGGLGYRLRDSRPVVPIPASSHGGDWLLMTKAMAASNGRA